jgi:hypothetical protein
LFLTARSLAKGWQTKIAANVIQIQNTADTLFRPRGTVEKAVLQEYFLTLVGLGAYFSLGPPRSMCEFKFRWLNLRLFEVERSTLNLELLGKEQSKSLRFAAHFLFPSALFSLISSRSARQRGEVTR